MGLTGPVKKLAEFVFNPDRVRATGGLYMEDRGKDTICVLRVRGLGALVFRHEESVILGNDKGGISIYTEDEIRHGRIETK